MITSSERAAGDFAADLAALRQDVARLTETMSDLVQHRTQAAGRRVFEAVGDARERLAGTAADAQKGICAVSGAIGTGIARNPMTAVLIAFAVGLSLGLLRPSRG